MKKLLTFAMLTMFALLYARGATPDTKSAPGATAPATVAAAVDPKITELEAKVETFSSQVENMQRGVRAIQEQRNTLAAQLLDAQANVQLLSQSLGEKDAMIANLKKKAGDKPPELVPPVPSLAGPPNTPIPNAIVSPAVPKK